MRGTGGGLLIRGNVRLIRGRGSGRLFQFETSCERALIVEFIFMKLVVHLISLSDFLSICFAILD